MGLPLAGDLYIHKGLMCFAALELQCSFIYMASACAECALPMNVFGHSRGFPGGVVRHAKC